MLRQDWLGLWGISNLSSVRQDRGRNSITCTRAGELKTGTLLCNAAHADVISPSQGKRAMHGQSVKKGKAALRPAVFEAAGARVSRK